MFAKYPRTPSDSLPNTPGGPRRRIRCKMCRYVKLSLLNDVGFLQVAYQPFRQELATREHMLDHGQLGPATPVDSPVTSRRPSGSTQAASVHRRPSGESAPRRPSRLSFSSKLGESLSMSSIEPENTSAIVQSVHPLHTLRSMSRTAMDSTSSALDIEDESETESNAIPVDSPGSIGLTKEDVSIDAAQISGLQLSDAVISTVADNRAQLEAQSKDGDTTGDGAEPHTTHFISPSELASQLFTNSKLAVLRSANTPVSPNSVNNSPPILLNAKCSGYFVEPVSLREVKIVRSIKCL